MELLSPQPVSAKIGFSLFFSSLQVIDNSLVMQANSLSGLEFKYLGNVDLIANKKSNSS